MSVSYFAFYAVDRPGVEAERARLREAHRQYIRQSQPGCRVVAGGPLVDDADERLLGTLLIFEARDRAAVESFVAGDPYAAGRLFARTEIRRWRWGLGAP